MRVRALRVAAYNSLQTVCSPRSGALHGRAQSAIATLSACSYRLHTRHGQARPGPAGPTTRPDPAPPRCEPSWPHTLPRGAVCWADGTTKSVFPRAEPRPSGGRAPPDPVPSILAWCHLVHYRWVFPGPARSDVLDCCAPLALKSEAESLLAAPPKLHAMRSVGASPWEVGIAALHPCVAVDRLPTSTALSAAEWAAAGTRSKDMRGVIFHSTLESLADLLQLALIRGRCLLATPRSITSDEQCVIIHFTYACRRVASIFIKCTAVRAPPRLHVYAAALHVPLAAPGGYATHWALACMFQARGGGRGARGEAAHTVPCFSRRWGKIYYKVRKRNIVWQSHFFTLTDLVSFHGCRRLKKNTKISREFAPF